MRENEFMTVEDWLADIDAELKNISGHLDKMCKILLSMVKMYNAVTWEELISILKEATKE